MCPGEYGNDTGNTLKLPRSGLWRSIDRGRVATKPPLFIRCSRMWIDIVTTAACGSGARAAANRRSHGGHRRARGWHDPTLARQIGQGELAAPRQGMVHAAGDDQQLGINDVDAHVAFREVGRRAAQRQLYVALTQLAQIDEQRLRGDDVEHDARVLRQ